jgi:hypothetical protein
MQPFLLLGSLQPIANFIGAIALLAGGGILTAGVKIQKANASQNAFTGLMAMLLLLGGGLLLVVAAFCFFPSW